MVSIARAAPPGDAADIENAKSRKGFHENDPE